MRILTVSHFFENHGGGIERVAGKLSREFAELGATATWVASEESASAADASAVGGVHVVPLACINPTEKFTGLPMPVPVPRGIRRLAAEVSRSDAVIIHDALYATSILAMVIAKARRKRVILIQHIADIPFSARALRLLLRVANLLVTRPMLRLADARVFISAVVQQDLAGNPARFPSEVLFNGVDRSVFYPPADEAGRSQPTMRNAGVETRRVLFVGRYVEKKGLAVLRALAASRPDLTFLMAGSGPIRPTDWGLANVRDLGVQTPEAIADLYRGADLLLLPSVGEGYPLVIQEAMACGLPVICGSPSHRADPAAARWLGGITIDLSRPQESARRCSEAIDAVALGSADRQEMAHYAAKRYDWRVMAQRLLMLAEPQASGK